jgi:hypothetical protein
VITLLPCIYIVSSPPFFPVDTEIADDALTIDYFTVGDSFSSAEQTGKHPHFEHSDIAYSLLSIACIRIALLLFYLF